MPIISRQYSTGWWTRSLHPSSNLQMFSQTKHKREVNVREIKTTSTCTISTVQRAPRCVLHSLSPSSLPLSLAQMDAPLIFFKKKAEATDHY